MSGEAIAEVVIDNLTTKIYRNKLGRLYGVNERGTINYQSAKGQEYLEAFIKVKQEVKEQAEQIKEEPEEDGGLFW